MMFVVSVSLNPKRDASAILEELQRSAYWMHYLDETWLIDTNESVDALYQRIAKYTSVNDRVLVIQLARDNPIRTNLPSDAMRWLAERLASNYFPELIQEEKH